MAKELSDTDAFASPIRVPIQGEEYELSPIGPGDLAAFKQWVRAQRLQWFREYGRSDDSKEDMALMSEIVRKPIDESELVDEMMTAEGGIFLLWRCIKKNHPDVTLDELQSKLSSIEEIREVMEIANTMSGLDVEEGGEGEGDENPPQKTQTGES